MNTTENTQAPNMRTIIKKEHENDEVKISLKCRTCGQEYETEENPNGKDTIKSFIKNWRTISGWLINQKCSCGSPFTMEMFINKITVLQYWEYLHKEVLTQVPIIEMATPQTKGEAIKYFINECKNCLDFRQDYVENASIKNRYDLIKPISPLACGVSKDFIEFYDNKASVPLRFPITSYEYDKLKKAYLKGVKV